MRRLGTGWLRRAFAEPLLHFVVLGAILFMLASGSEEMPAPDRIVIGEGQIRNLAAVFERTWRRPPTEAELDGLIRDRIDEEVLAREARDLGLDQDDTVIRRRLRQKMEFVAQDLAPPEPASEDALQAYLAAHPERFTRPGRLTFTQVFLNPERRGPTLAQHAAGLLRELDAAPPEFDPGEVGDPSLLDPHYADVSTDEVARLLGPDFAARLEDLPVGRWAGPVASPYGAHLVRIAARSAPSLPPLAEVRDEVALEVEAERVVQAREAFVAALRQRYEVVVERPRAALAEASEGEEALR